MSELWYIYDYDSCPCDECGSLAYCAVWRMGDSDEFMAVCGYCDQPWREKKVLADGK